MRRSQRNDVLSVESVRETLLDARARLLTVKLGILEANDDPAPDDEGIILPISERARSLTAMIDEHLHEIAEALDRVRSGMYGICAGCGEQIPARRLEALPTAALCVLCQGAAHRHSGRVTGAVRSGHHGQP